MNNKKHLIKFLTMNSMENLSCWVTPGRGAVLKFGEKVIVVSENWKGGYEAAIYEPLETPEEAGVDFIECRLSLAEILDEVFEDSGHAVAMALTKVQ